jgi:hypothetical protein
MDRDTFAVPGLNNVMPSATDLTRTSIQFPVFREWWNAFPRDFSAQTAAAGRLPIIGLFPVTDALATEFM